MTELMQEFEGFKSFQAQNLFNRLVDLRNSIEISEQSLEGKIKNLKGTKETALKALEEIKNNADIVGLLPSVKKMLKIFNDLEMITTNGELVAGDYQDQIFAQKYYKFFYQARLGFSKATKIKILESGEFIQSIKHIYDSFNPNDKQLKAIVSIISLQLKDNANIKPIFKLYAKSSIVRANIESIAIISNILHENKSLHLFESNLVNLLAIASLVKKANLKKNQKNSLIENIKLYLKSNNIDEVFDNIIATKTVKRALDGKYNIQLFIACEVFGGDKSILDIEVDEKFIKTITSFKAPAKNYIKTFNKIIKSIDINSVEYLIENYL